MKKLNIKGFSHLEVLLTILVVVAVAGIGYFGYQRFQSSNGSKAAAGSYAFVRNPSQMTPSRRGSIPITDRPSTLVGSAELRKTKTLCSHYTTTGSGPWGRVIIEQRVPDSRYSGGYRVVSSAKKDWSNGVKSANICTKVGSTANSGVAVIYANGLGIPKVVVDTIYGKR